MLKQRRVRENAGRALQVDEAVQLFAFCMSDVKQLPGPAVPPSDGQPAAAPNPDGEFVMVSPSADAAAAAEARRTNQSQEAAAASSSEAASQPLEQQPDAPESVPESAAETWSGAPLHADRLTDCIGLPIPTAAGTLTNAGGRE